MRDKATRDEALIRLLHAENGKGIAVRAGDNRPNVRRAGQRLPFGIGPFAYTGHLLAALPTTDFQFPSTQL
jgi:hypothetical protein